ncbi:MAG: ADP-ribosylglycohydrolase family protein [Flavobacteriaceae bacterium]
MNNLISQILLGVAVADALGVPVEFKSREYLRKNPVTDMLEYGTHTQPKGTWSDDTSLSLCLAESILEGLDLNRLAQKFIAWKNDGYMTPHGYMFDIGGTTRAAIGRMEDGIAPELCGFSGENDNGNGSLMRILPLLALTKDLPLEERFELTKKVSSMTHSHIRSVLACHYYLEFAKKILEGKTPKESYFEMQTEFSDFMSLKQISLNEMAKFSRLLNGGIFELGENEIQSSGYVIHSLEASIWCLLTTNNYKEAVLKAVNLGSDTDTTAAITGGLAVLTYRKNSIPNEWINELAPLPI